MTIFFTSDHHFGHKNIIKYSNRPFSSSEEMDKIMIERWNEKVKPEDIVYYLGDFSLSENDKYIDDIFLQLNGKIYIMKGNHDYWMERNTFYPITKNSTVKLIEPLYNLYLDHPELKKPKGHLPIVLCHYSLRTWDVAHYGSWMLYGHSHGQLPPYGKSFDIGVDTNNFYPYSLEEVNIKMKARPLKFDLTSEDVWR